MNKRVVQVVLVCGGLVSGLVMPSCKDDEPTKVPPVQVEARSVPPPGVKTSPLYPVHPVDPSNRYTLVGQRRTPDAQCPSPLQVAGGEWRGKPLLDRMQDEKLPARSQGMCIYEWSPAQGMQQAQPHLPPPSALVAFRGRTLTQDFMTMAPQGKGLPESASKALGNAFFGHLGYSELSKNATGKVRIEVIDTWPDDATGAPPTWVDGRSPHGFNMLWLAYGLTRCAPSPSAQCPITKVSRLGLPRIDSATKDTANGGYFGNKGDLALAIHAATTAWLSTNSQEKERLVVSLGAGWEPRPEVADPCGKSTRDGKLVFDALNRATCAGALVIAAAGNTSNNGDGAVCPARWADQVAACDGFKESDPALASIKLPLLHAAGGIDYSGHPITGHRANSWPRLAVLAHQGLAFDGVKVPKGAMIHTGTSVAATVLSALAARTWAAHNGGTKTAQGIMDDLYATGTDILVGGAKVPANVWPFTATPFVKCVDFGNLPGSTNCASGGKNPGLTEAAQQDLESLLSPVVVQDAGVSDAGAVIGEASKFVVPQPRTGCGLCFGDLSSPEKWLVNIVFSDEAPSGTSEVQVDILLSDDTIASYWVSPSGGWSKDVTYQFDLGAAPEGVSPTRTTLTWSYLGVYDSQVIMFSGP